MDSTFLGRLLGLDSPGDFFIFFIFLDWTGEVAPLDIWYSAGEQSEIKIAGDVCYGMFVYSVGEC